MAYRRNDYALTEAVASSKAPPETIGWGTRSNGAIKGKPRFRICQECMEERIDFDISTMYCQRCVAIIAGHPA